MPILSTKLHIPPLRPKLVPRLDLAERLDEGLCRKLTLVSAPAGFGKTTLVSAWLHSLGARSQLYPRVAWLSLDDSDNDPGRLLAYFITALRQTSSDIGQSVQGTIRDWQPGLPALEAAMVQVINDLAALDGELLCVFDDYHIIKTESIHQGLTFLLDHLPPQVHLILITRSDPPLPLSRWRARDQLTEIRAIDLRFSLDEATEFLNLVMQLDLSFQDIETLTRRTEGWIGGLQLAAVSLHEQGRRGDFIATFGGDDRYITDYLLDEVFARQSPDVQNFLLQTSILDRLCGPLCDAVVDTAQANGQWMLEQLERNNLFVIPLDSRRQWYRHHQLFADLLRRYLVLTHAGNLPELHRRAARWYGQHHLLDEAIAHFLAAEDFEEAGLVIEQVGVTKLWQNGEVATLYGWLEKLPLDLIRARPRLSLLSAWLMLIQDQYDGLEQLLETIVTGLPELASPPTAANLVEVGSIIGEIATIRIMLNIRSDLPDRSVSLALADAALQYLPAEAHHLQVIVTAAAAQIHYLNGDMPAAEQHFARAGELGWAHDNLLLAVISTLRLAHIQILRGHLCQAFQICEQVQDRLDRPGLSLNWLRYVVLGELLLERNDLEGAAACLRQCVANKPPLGKMLPLLLAGYVSLARVLQAQGNTAGAFQMLQEAAQVEQPSYGLEHWWDWSSIETYQARLELARGNLAAVAEWAEVQGLTATDLPVYKHEVEYLLLARLLIAQGRAGEALALLGRIQQGAEAGGRTGRVIEILALRALAQQRAGAGAEACVTLAQGLRLAEPEGYIRLFVDEGRPMYELLCRFRDTLVSTRPANWPGVTPDYVARLLAAFAGPAEGDPPPPLPVPDPLVESLSDSELAILRLLNLHLSNQEIAGQLCLSVNTVKWHIRNLYGKLAVGKRAEAVDRAHELHLL